MNTYKKNYILIMAAILLIVSAPTKSFFQTLTQANTTITNVAEGEYEDDEGKTFETVSPPVVVEVQAVSSIVVTPDETNPSEVVVANETIVREFSVCNTSNQADSYTITTASVSAPAQIESLFYDADNNGTISSGDVEITLGQALSNIVNPNSCIKILVRIDTNDLSLNQEVKVDLTARSNDTNTVNGRVEDSGSILNNSGTPANFTDPVDPTLIPSKLVENQSSYVSSKNEALDYAISFKNSGDAQARNVVVSDELPDQLTYVAGTLKLDGVSLTDVEDADEGHVIGKNVIVRLSSPLNPGEVVTVTFKALVGSGSAPGQGIVNVANVSADNAVTADTTQAIAVIDPFGTVYAARGGASSPIAGATVAILTNANSNSPLPIPSGQGFEPNFDNDNPYITDNQGRFAFALRPDQLGTPTQPATYVVRVTAENFRSRLIQISLSPAGNGLFRMIVSSLDGLPIAIADGFALTENDVEISSIADIAFNIPMFEEATIEVNKSADRIQGEIGDIVNYRVEVANTSVAPMLNVVVRDTLPDSFSYAPETARIIRGTAETKVEPKINGKVLEFVVGDLASGERFSILYRVRIGVNAQRGDNYNLASVSGNFGSGEIVKSADARALVRVSPGLFSMQQFIIGRVYADKNQNNVFDFGEKPVVGARLYLSNGNSVVTDSQGLYSIPAVSRGAQVIALDPVTIPEFHVLTDNRSRSGKDWTRLLRTPLGGGGMLRQNFALVSTQDENEADNDKKIIKTKLAAAEKAKKEKSEKTTAKKRVFKNVAPGDLVIHDFSEGSVALDPAVNMDVSVATGWSAELELNGKKVNSNTIGSTRKDPKNKIVTYSFIGLGLKPGPNKVRATAVSPDSSEGNSTEIEVFGRGPIKDLEITSARKELQASGRDSTKVVVRALDAWGNPAQDSSVMIQTSAGRILNPDGESKPKDNSKSTKGVFNSNLNPTEGITSEQVNDTKRQQLVSLVNGIGEVELISDNKTGVAKIEAAQGSATAETEIRFTSEIRPTFLAGLAELTIGKAAPEMFNRNVDETVRGHVQFFYRGSVFDKKNVLTLAYDSQQPLNRVGGRDRLFQLNPLDQIYPLFGDSSTRFQETESNSKIYARFDRGRSYAMFGDFETGLENKRLVGYGRRLTGGKVHIENSVGDSITVTGARPDTAFARQVIPGGSLGLIQLGFGDIMQGSEVLAIETRDRRNPELIISREILSRSVDYNIDTSTGTIFFLRQVPTFDRELNLNQIVATYEYRSEGFESSVYTANASKNFTKLGLRLGFSYINQKQTDSSPFQLGGIDGSFKLPNKGKLEFEWARSKGVLNRGFGFFNNNPSGNGEYNGDAFLVSLDQPIAFGQSVLRFDGYSASRNFYNPFGATVTPGTIHGALVFETKPFKNSTIRANFVGEKNLTDNVDNNRVTAAVDWTQTLNDKFRFNFGYSMRRFADNQSDNDVVSNLITVGANYRPTTKIELSAKREQNLGDEDPSYPNQTTFAVNYHVNDFTKVFFTQRLASNPITPISDTAGTGFASSKARNETALGVETRFGKYTSLSGRYQIENGVNGTDSFSIIGLKNRLPINKQVALDFGYERAFHLAGNGKSYNNFSFGANWLPDENFRTSFRYVLRDREGFGHIFSLGSAGKLKPGWTTMGRFQYGEIDFNGRTNIVMNGQLALAIRPHDTDKYGVLFGYKHRESFFSGKEGEAPNEIRNDILSVDGFHQTTRRLELYGRFALKHTADKTPNLPFASNLTLLMQGRAQYRLDRYWDLAGEGRFLYQPSTGSQNRWLGAETGYWATPDLRIGGGYNFAKSKEVYGFTDNSVYNRSGFYFVLSTKVSNLFDLFGTSKEGLKSHEEKKRRSKNRRIATKK